MYVRRNIRWHVILKFAWKSVAVFTVYSLLVCLMYRAGIRSLDIPWQPVATLGIAVSFYIGFKNNGAYDRFWEGRKLWGGIVNYSRTWAVESLEFITSVVDAPDVQAPPATGDELSVRHRRLVYRQIAWCNALRLALRRQPDLWDEAGGPLPRPDRARSRCASQNRRPICCASRPPICGCCARSAACSTTSST